VIWFSKLLFLLRSCCGFNKGKGSASSFQTISPAPPRMRLGANAATSVRRALLCAWYRTTGKRPLYLALCWIWDLGSAVLQGTLRICMPAYYSLILSVRFQSKYAPTVRYSPVSVAVRCRFLATRTTFTFSIGSRCSCLLRFFLLFQLLKKKRSRLNFCWPVHLQVSRLQV
jgi:hypothetical protein